MLWDQLHRCHDSGTKDTDHDNTNSNSSSNNNKNDNDDEEKEKEHSVIQRYTSSSVASRGFCKKCGTTIYMDYGEPHTIWIPIGIVNDVTVEKVQDWIRLRGREEEPRDSHIFTESKATGITELLQQKLPFMENFGSFIYDSCNPKKGHHEKKTLTKKPSEIKMEPPFVFKGIDDIAKHVENLKQKEKQEEQTKE